MLNSYNFFLAKSKGSYVLDFFVYQLLILLRISIISLGSDRLV